MPGTRDHAPLVIEDFQGLWKRGDDESAPSDHFIQADNIQYFHSGFETRDGLVPYLNDSFVPLRPIRIYNYVTQTRQTLLVLTVGGNIHHITGPNNEFPDPILTIPEMEDFGFVAIAGRAYITPFKTYTNLDGEKYQLGIKNEFLYVYLGDGNTARKAAGKPPVNNDPANPFEVQPTGTGITDLGFHIFAVVYETVTGFITAPGPEVFATMDITLGVTELEFFNIPTDTTFNSSVVKRHLLSTKAIPNYNGNQLGYQFFFIPGAVINDNTSTAFTVHSMFDSDLVDDASKYFDNFSEIPSGVALNTYHSRLVLVGEFGIDETLQGLPVGVNDNRSIARVSLPGDPESIDKITGLIIVPLDGKALTQVQELRDVLFLFKNTRTYSYSDGGKDSGLTPAEWQEEVVDQGIGSPVHGIATVLDSGGSNIDFLLIVDWSGLLIFNGTYAQPELTWKIEDIWRDFDRNLFNQIQIANDSLNKHLYICLPDPNRKIILHADYANGLNAKDIRWTRWIFDTSVNTITLIGTDQLTIGAVQPGFVQTRG